LHKSTFAQEARDKYLGNNIDKINLYDPIFLIENSNNLDQIKIDVGLNDEFLDDLFINDFEKICEKQNQKLIIKKHNGYDHGYYFIQTFIEDHLIFHSLILNK